MRGGREGVCRGIGAGEGANFFLSGQKCPPSLVSPLEMPPRISRS